MTTGLDRPWTDLLPEIPFGYPCDHPDYHRKGRIYMTETATGVRGQGQEKAQQAQDKAHEVASKASDRARTQVDQRSTELGHRVTSTADDMRTISQQLREQGKDQPAKLTEQAAGKVERMGSWLRDNDSDRLLSDVEDLGRRQPWAFTLGGLVLGIAAARVLKASSTHRYERRQSQTFSPRGTGDGYAEPTPYGREPAPMEPAGGRTEGR
jgi:hypothetical protein